METKPFDPAHHMTSLEAQQELLNLARKLEAEGKMTLKVEADDDLAV